MNTTTIACVILLGALCVNSQKDRFHGNRVVDCAYGPWSEWRPFGNGDVIRERNIVRSAANGGKQCTESRYEVRNATEIRTPSLSKFLSMFISGDRREVTTRDSLLQRGQVPDRYTLSRDIVILIDTTLFPPAIPLYKSLLSNLVGSVCGDVGREQSSNIFTLIEYDSREVRVLHTFLEEQTKPAIQNKILSIQSTNGESTPSLLKRAMKKANTYLSSVTYGTRGYNLAHKDVLLFVTYRTLCSEVEKLANQHLKITARVYVVVLGEAGDSTLPPQDWCLHDYASSQFDFHFLWVRNYEDLRQFSTWALEITSYFNPCQKTENQSGAF